jgi:hypothetical protein
MSSRDSARERILAVAPEATDDQVASLIDAAERLSAAFNPFASGVPLGTMLNPILAALSGGKLAEDHPVNPTPEERLARWFERSQRRAWQ